MDRTTTRPGFLLEFAPEEALANLEKLRNDFDVYTELGFYDAVNVNTGEVSPYYLALDQGMIMAALGNYLRNDRLEHYFTHGEVRFMVVGLGDNFYPAGPTSPDSPLFQTHFEDIYAGLPLPFLMIPGNHDESRPYLGGDGGNPDAADAQVAYGRRGGRWVMPGRSYSAAFPVTDARDLTGAPRFAA